MRLLKNTNYQFLKFSKTAVIISIGIILVGLVSLFFVRGLNFGIDFTGGTLVQVQMSEPVETATVRGVLKNVELDNVVIQKMSTGTEFLIRVPQIEGMNDVQERIYEGLRQIEGVTFEELQAQQVGPKIGDELRGSAVKAILWAIIVIAVYISIRFQFRFAIGAVAALVHDVLFTLGLFSILQLEFSLSTLAAFLTIIGYSLNDTIVLYDRIRENLKKNRFDPISKVVNTSINETLSRTIITSVTTFIVVLVLAFSKGEVQIFAIAMCIGVVVGTYSSIYIAGPVLVLWQQRAAAKKK